jgi:AcrR family transcriptional regulator
VSARRETLLDAAVDVLGRYGARRLTHRAVDSAAGCPPGSTSNYFRTRDALVGGVVERVVDRERDAWKGLAEASPPTSPDGLARLLADLALLATGQNRTLTLARYVLLVEGALDASLRARLAAGGRRAGEGGADLLRSAGSADPDRHSRLVENCWTGLVLHQLAMPHPDFDPRPELEALVGALVPRSAAEG